MIRLPLALILVALLLPASAAASDVQLQLTGGKTVALPRTSLQVAGVTVRSLRATLAPAAVSALLRGKRVTLAQGTASRLTYTRSGSRALRRPRLRGRVFGKLLVGPAPLARPATAVDLKTTTLSWHVRDSFVQYMKAGEGTAASNGAAATGDYDFAFPFVDGWTDTASGKLRARFRGTVRFSYKAHGIAISASDPEIELDGARSRAIFRIASGKAAAQRAVLVNLDLAKAEAVGDARKIPGTIPASATSSVFAGYYLPGDPFGWITLGTS